MLILQIILSTVLSYLIGAIPTGYLFGKFLKGIDIRQHGSGNMGATNVLRVLGKGPGAAVLILDIVKGVIPTTLIAGLFNMESIAARVFLGVVAVAGHNWTVFLNFKGGKGIATSLGVLIGLTIAIPAIRPVLFYTLVSWAVVFGLSGYVSLASIVASTVLPVAAVVTYQDIVIIYLGIIFCLFVVVRHRPNIKRLLKGEESRIFRPFWKRK